MGERKAREAPSLFNITSVPERLPLVLMVITFTFIAIWDHHRDLILWRNYATIGATGTMVFGIFLWSGRFMIPRSALYMGFLTLILHFGGGSLGAADHGPGPLCWGGMVPGEGLCADGVNGMYHVHPMWDRLTHGFGGAAIAYGLLISWRRLNTHFQHGLSDWMTMWLAFSLALALMAAFEVYEFFGRMFFLTIDQGGYRNTAGDLVSDIFGCLAGVWGGLTLDRREFGSNEGGAWPWPFGVHLTHAFSLPLLFASFVAVADFLLFGGYFIDHDYDRLGYFLTSTLFLSSLTVVFLLLLTHILNRYPKLVQVWPDSTDEQE